jgi:hypothetical protein
MKLIRYSIFNPYDKDIGFMAIAQHYIHRNVHRALVTDTLNPKNLETSIAKNYTNTPGAIYDNMLTIQSQLEEKIGVAYEFTTRTFDDVDEEIEEFD